MMHYNFAATKRLGSLWFRCIFFNTRARNLVPSSSQPSEKAGNIGVRDYRARARVTFMISRIHIRKKSLIGSSGFQKSPAVNLSYTLLGHMLLLVRILMFILVNGISCKKADFLFARCCIY